MYSSSHQSSVYRITRASRGFAGNVSGLRVAEGVGGVSGATDDAWDAGADDDGDDGGAGTKATASGFNWGPMTMAPPFG